MNAEHVHYIFYSCRDKSKGRLVEVKVEILDVLETGYSLISLLRILTTGWGGGHRSLTATCLGAAALVAFIKMSYF